MNNNNTQKMKNNSDRLEQNISYTILELRQANSDGDCILAEQLNDELVRLRELRYEVSDDEASSHQMRQDN
jgi:hypothetical protein